MWLRFHVRSDRSRSWRRHLWYARCVELSAVQKLRKLRETRAETTSTTSDTSEMQVLARCGRAMWYKRRGEGSDRQAGVSRWCRWMNFSPTLATFLHLLGWLKTNKLSCLCDMTFHCVLICIHPRSRSVPPVSFRCVSVRPNENIIQQKNNKMKRFTSDNTSLRSILVIMFCNEKENWDFQTKIQNEVITVVLNKWARSIWWLALRSVTMIWFCSSFSSIIVRRSCVLHTTCYPTKWLRLWPADVGIIFIQLHNNYYLPRPTDHYFPSKLCLLRCMIPTTTSQHLNAGCSPLATIYYFCL